MKTKLFTLFVALVATSTLWAQSFSFNAGDFRYTITSRSEPYTVRLINASSNITVATIPSSVYYGGYVYSVTSIGDSAFDYCRSLTSVTIPNSVTSIGYYAFSNCSSLTSVTIGESVTSIDNTSFSNCSKLTSVTIKSDAIVSQDYYSSFYGCSYIFGSQVTEYIIGNTVKGIGEYAFSDCSSLTSVIIPNSVISIGDRAFSDCSSLTSVTIPNSVTSIGKSAFSDCSSLTSITIGNSVTYIGDYAFYWCTSLTSVTIPNSVTSIGERAFSGCSSLTSITIGNSVTSIGDAAFFGTGIYNDESNWENNVLYIDDCLIEAKTSISGAYTIKENTRLIGDWAFSGCRSLTSITIGNSVTYIGDCAFYWCTSLTSVTIPNSVTSIGERAFSACSSLTSITCLGTTPPEASNLGANTSTCKLIVPRSAYNAYLRHAYWGQFLNIVPSSEMESSAPEIYVNPANPAQKLLRNGQVYILKDDKTYTIMGAQIQ